MVAVGWLFVWLGTDFAIGDAGIMLVLYGRLNQLTCSTVVPERVPNQFLWGVFAFDFALVHIGDGALSVWFIAALFWTTREPPQCQFTFILGLWHFRSLIP